uniref:Transmembrane protein 220 n=1 Tax=Oryzias latipes TaxID=8090 RepID=A0A3B3I7Y3_ORYLA
MAPLLKVTCNALMCLFFTLASYVQINDPDAGLWMVRDIAPVRLTAAMPRVFFCPPPHPGCLLPAETLAWRRVADLHVMISCAVTPLKLSRNRKLMVCFKRRECSGLMLTGVWLLLCRHSGRAPVGALRVSTAAAITVFPFAAWLYYHTNKDLRSDWPSHCTTAL